MGIGFIIVEDSNFKTFNSNVDEEVLKKRGKIYEINVCIRYTRIKEFL